MIVIAVDRERLILSHLHIGREVASYARFEGLRRRFGFDELQAAAHEAIVEAAQDYDPARSDHGFDPYARKCALNRILRLAGGDWRFVSTSDVEIEQRAPEAKFEALELLALLDDDDRQLVERHVVGGSSLVSLAREQGVAKVTIRHRISAALLKMRIAAGG